MEPEKTLLTASGKTKEHYPLFKSMEEAAAYSHKVGDNYYVTAFMLEIWLGDLITANVTNYADQNPNKREMQTGQAFRHEVFRKLFTDCKDEAQLHHFISSLLRFGKEDDNFAKIILLTFGLFGPENEVNPIVDIHAIRPGPDAAELMRRYIKRFCDWLDCHLHFNTHFLSYHAPGSFFPGDEEARHLYALGLAQRNLPQHSAYDQTFWQWNHETALEQLTRRDKWAKFLAAGVKHEDKRHHTHPEVDDCVIGCWPLVKRFQWSYNELLAVLDHALPQYQGRYPCDSYVSLQKHCIQTLGLKKGTGGKRATAGKPHKHYSQGKTRLPEGFNVFKVFLDQRDAARRESQGR